MRLPNNLILPIDSKWSATHLLEQLINCSDPTQQVQIKKEIENALLAKAREVKKYIDPSLTTTFGIAVVPDAIFEVSFAVQPDIIKKWGRPGELQPTFALSPSGISNQSDH